MGANTFSTFNFFKRYKWTAQNFTDFQTMLLEWANTGRQGLHGAACVKGLQIVPVSGMTVTVKAGIGITPAGKVLVLATDTNVTLSAPSGNPNRTYLVLRTLQTDANLITRPTTPFDTVALNEIMSAQVVEIDGAPGASPVYPALGADDLVLMGFKLTNGQVTIVYATHCDVTQRNVWVRNRHAQITQVAGSYTVVEGDEVIEIDATTGAAAGNLPAANTACGRLLTFVKVDTSANAVSPTGAGSDLVCGAASIPLIKQFDFITLYCNGVGWNQRA